MVLSRRKAKPRLDVERFERIDAGEEMALLRLTLALPRRSNLESPVLAVARDGAETELAPLPTPESADGADQGVWRRAFGAPIEIVANEGASYSLRADGGIEVELPRPVGRQDSLEQLEARLEFAEGREREASQASEGAAAQLEKHTAAAAAAEGRTKELEEALQSSERQLEEERGRIEELETALQDSQDRAREEAQASEGTAAQLEEYTAAAAAAEGRTNELQEALQSSERQVEEERGRIEELETALRDGEARLEEAEGRLEQQAELLEAARSRLTGVREALSARAVELSDLMDTLEPAEQDSELST